MYIYIYIYIYIERLSSWWHVKQSRLWARGSPDRMRDSPDRMPGSASLAQLFRNGFAAISQLWRKCLAKGFWRETPNNSRINKYIYIWPLIRHHTLLFYIIYIILYYIILHIYKYIYIYTYTYIYIYKWIYIYICIYWPTKFVPLKRHEFVMACQTISAMGSSPPG